MCRLEERAGSCKECGDEIDPKYTLCYTCWEDANTAMCKNKDEKRVKVEPIGCQSCHQAASKHLCATKEKTFPFLLGVTGSSSHE
jgi:hypothetical protein